MVMKVSSRYWLGVTSLLLVSSAATITTVLAEGLTLSIHGSGTTNPSKCYWHVMDLMEDRSKLPMKMTYRAIGSSAGQAEFSQTPAITAFGSGDIPLTKDLWDGFQTAGTTVFQLPVFVGAVSFFHSVPNTSALNLTACTLAKIFKREITAWDHEDIKSLNPEMVIPSGGLEIRVARRVDGSSSTSGITSYLGNACPDVWSPDNVGSSVEWPEGTLECQGSGGVVDCINREIGTIGYLDSGHGHNAGFEEVYLENAAGTKLTTIQSMERGGVAAAADAQGLMPANPSDDFSQVSLINQPGEFTWPVSLMTYVYVRQDVSSSISVPQEQALLKAFLQALYDDSFVDDCVQAYEFSKVTGSALELATRAIDSLTIDASSTPFQFEEETVLNDGQGDYYISAKRDSAVEVELEVLTTANAKLTAQVAELDRMLTQAMVQMAQITGTEIGANPSFATAGEPVSESTKDGEIAAALAMSIISLILSFVVLAMIAFRTFAGTHHPHMEGHISKDHTGQIPVEEC